MILDLFSNHAQYAALHPLFGEAFAFLAGISPDLAPGRYELASPGMYAMVQEYTTQPAAGARFEAHRRYIDIQFLVRGREAIHYAPAADLQSGEYQPEKDYQPLDGSGSALGMHAGEFAVFFPQDAHLPGRELNGPQAVRKIVVKVPVSK